MVFLRALGAVATPIAAVARWQHTVTVVEVAPSTAIRLAMSLMEDRNARNRDGTRRSDRTGGSSLSTFSPAEGASVEVDGGAGVLQLFLDQGFAQTALDSPFACPPMYGLRDTGVQALMMQVLAASTKHGPDDAVAVEEALHALVHRIGRHAAQSRDQAENAYTLYRVGLAPTAFRRVEAMISTALDERLSPTLQEMAAAAGLSVTHFIRAFRHHTSVTPHQYLIRRRMQRAVSHLRDARSSIGEIADDLGFAASAHFVATFRAAMGIMPGAVRNALRA